MNKVQEFIRRYHVSISIIIAAIIIALVIKNNTTEITQVLNEIKYVLQHKNFSQ